MAEENKYNILIECGADFVLPFTLYDNNGDPYDLTGATVEAQLRETPSSNHAYDFVCSHNGAGGRIIISMPYEVTSQVSYSYGVYDVFVNMPGGVRKRPIYGDVIVQDHVTKPLDGTMLYMIGVNSYEDLPAEGLSTRLYFCYEDRKIYRWNGQNYIATSIGNGIQYIRKTGATGGIYDHYTVFYDDGTTWQFTVTNGRGITNIEKLNDGHAIVDTYRMIFGDGTYYDYYVRNGGVAYATFEVDLETGILMMNEPDNIEFPNFNVNQNTGQLEVVI